VDRLFDHVHNLRPAHIGQFVPVRGLAARPQEVAEEPGVLLGDLLRTEELHHAPVDALVVGHPQGGVPCGTVSPSVVGLGGHGRSIPFFGGVVKRDSEGNQTFSDQLLCDSLVRPLEFVDHARVAQRLKQGDGLFVGQFAVLESDDVLGEQVHGGSIPGLGGVVKG
jgi:hypothetical protein